MAKTYKCSKVMSSCRYSERLRNKELFCDYIGHTGHRRCCNPEECDKYERRDYRKKRYNVS